MAVINMLEYKRLKAAQSNKRGRKFGLGRYFKTAKSMDSTPAYLFIIAIVSTNPLFTMSL